MFGLPRKKLKKLFLYRPSPPIHLQLAVTRMCCYLFFSCPSMILLLGELHTPKLILTWGPLNISNSGNPHFTKPFTFACGKKTLFFFTRLLLFSSKKGFPPKKKWSQKLSQKPPRGTICNVVVNTMGVHRFTCPTTVPKPRRGVETKQLGDDLGRGFCFFHPRLEKTRESCLILNQGQGAAKRMVVEPRPQYRKTGWEGVIHSSKLG